MSRPYVTINPCNMCQPLGAVLAFRGIENSMTLLHGSQGCSTYIRLHICHHFREPLDVASSALNEKEAVYGGAKNLKKGLRNVIERYQPGLIGVATTCLTETIAEDVNNIIYDFKERHQPKAHIIVVSTPSYNGSHNEGFNQTILALVESLAVKTKPSQKINLLISPGFSCSDIRYLKEIFECLNQKIIVLPDYSETFEAPLGEHYPKIPDGGTTFEEIKDTANSIASLSLGDFSKTVSLAGFFLEENYQVKNYSLNLPIGLRKTDEFFTTIKEISGANVPRKYQKQRGRLLDAFIDAHRYNFGIKTAICGDPDLVIGLTSLAVEIGLKPVLIASSSRDKNLREEIIKIMIDQDFEPTVLSPTDFDEVHHWVKKSGIQLMIGPSTAQFISEAEKIPLIRAGFPIHDRVGAQRKLVVGYEGAILLVDEIANTVLEHRLKKPFKEVIANV